MVSDYASEGVTGGPPPPGPVVPGGGSGGALWAEQFGPAGPGQGETRLHVQDAGLHATPAEPGLGATGGAPGRALDAERTSEAPRETPNAPARIRARDTAHDLPPRRHGVEGPEERLGGPHAS